jgi:hypothetical protein
MQYEGEHDKIGMSCTHQRDEESEKTLGRANEKRDVKCNMFSGFEMLTVECVL